MLLRLEWDVQNTSPSGDALEIQSLGSRLTFIFRFSLQAWLLDEQNLSTCKLSTFGSHHRERERERLNTKSHPAICIVAFQSRATLNILVGRRV